MYQATIVYGRPTDPDAFDRHYRQVHIPLASRMPRLTEWTLTWGDPGFDGSPAAAYLVAELRAETREDLQAAFESEAGRAAAADVASFATGGVTMHFGAVEPVPVEASR